MHQQTGPANKSVASNANQTVNLYGRRRADHLESFLGMFARNPTPASKYGTEKSTAVDRNQVIVIAPMAMSTSWK